MREGAPARPPRPPSRSRPPPPPPPAGASAAPESLGFEREAPGGLAFACPPPRAGRQAAGGLNG